jgi:hypothetical protein
VKLKCGEHAERESETRPIFVCHHCGKPVCEEHGWVVLADDAFGEVQEPVSRSAMHCTECAAKYHPRGASKRRGWVVRRPRAAADQEAPATAQPAPPQPYPQQPYPQQQPPPQLQPPHAPGTPRGGPRQP